MYIDTTALPDDVTASEFIKQWKQLASKQVFVTDPTKTINTIPGSTTDGLWSQINKTNTIPYDSPWEDPILKTINELELKNKLLELRLLVLEGKFTQEEVNNIKSMLTSNDEASITLADTIIENAW
jgi:hypothetical protein